MDFHAIVLRVLFAYLFLLLFLRIAGKRSIYQGTPLDFVVALIAGDMIDDLLWGEVPTAQFVVGVGAVVTVHVLAAVAVCRSPLAARLIQGMPVTLVREGSLLEEPLRRERFTEADVMSALRQQEIEDLREVERATLENSGHVSVSLQQWARPAQRQDRERVREVAR